MDYDMDYEVAEDAYLDQYWEDRITGTDDYWGDNDVYFGGEFGDEADWDDEGVWDE